MHDIGYFGQFFQPRQTLADGAADKKEWSRDCVSLASMLVD